MLEELLASKIASAVSITPYPVMLPLHAEFPAVVYQVVAETPIAANDSGPSTLHRKRVQIEIWGDTYKQIATLRNTLKNSLDGWRNQNLVPRIDLCRFDMELDTFDPEREKFRKIVDFQIWYGG